MTLQKGDPGRQAGMAGVRQHVESVTSESSVNLRHAFIKIQLLSKFPVSVAFIMNRLLQRLKVCIR